MPDANTLAQSPPESPGVPESPDEVPEEAVLLARAYKMYSRGMRYAVLSVLVVAVSILATMLVAPHLGSTVTLPLFLSLAAAVVGFVVGVVCVWVGGFRLSFVEKVYYGEALVTFREVLAKVVERFFPPAAILFLTIRKFSVQRKLEKYGYKVSWSRIHHPDETLL